MKRFWKSVAVVAGDDGHTVHLDDKPIRTPGRAPLVLPTHALAEGVAQEWRAVGESIDPRAMILTGLANAAIDRIAPDRAAFAAPLAAYGDSDLLCYRAELPVQLRARQDATWDPPLAWARARYDVAFEIVTGVMPRPQPAATVERLGTALAARDAFELAALNRIVTITGSLVLALALAERAIDADAAWTAATLDEAWQAELWGEDAEAAQALARRRAEFDAAIRFLELLR